MSTSFHRVVASLVMLMAAGLSACGTRMLSDVDAQGSTDKPVFPAVQDANRPEGTYVNLENLSKVVPGMTKAQVLELIGPPHFAEGMFDVREWDYVLRLRPTANAAQRTCQYKVLFDDHLVARSFFALPQGCLDGLTHITPAAERHQAIAH